ncbi:flagella synthesis protein FlgN [Methylomonas rhizoryzae]|uniref:flagella synthesis protein FlgN n=1 Tax=Methylomonas rhizoryzae TaxID=2608981 RepID=UPI00123267E1|nr:flagellar protein FlgN [Methylomonas rhizoryzae]
MIDKTFPIAEKLLANGDKLTQRLMDLLTKEQEQLQRKFDPASIAAVAADKKEVVAHLEQFAKQLSQVLATEKLTLAQQGVQHYLTKARASGIDIEEPAKCWASIGNLSKTCRQLNEQNGAGIDILSRHTQRSLAILRGKSPIATTYGPDGSTRSELFSHTLISV